jgi:hypothetical protein
MLENGVVIPVIQQFKVSVSEGTVVIFGQQIGWNSLEIPPLLCPSIIEKTLGEVEVRPELLSAWRWVS